MNNRFFTWPRGTSKTPRELGRADRKMVRAALRCMRLDADNDDLVLDGSDIPNFHDHHSNRFHKRLSDRHIERWLRSRLGRPWAEVCRELNAKCGSAKRVMAEADKMARGSTDVFLEPFFIDGKGLLQANPDYVWRNLGGAGATKRDRRKPAKQVSESEINGWLKGRIVLERGSSLFWGVLNEVVIVLGHDKWQKLLRASGYRQSRPLNREETAFFFSLSPIQQREVIREGEQTRLDAKSNRAFDAEFDRKLYA